ncbi:universal stress protein [Natrarchaeobaculum sulfurireducens]|uniref:Chloride channel protein n=1 Tax=Natrarchaeobaculum sulfurireducens TaxID=2044521 RepID=A0A346PD34_9EURY|nr:universal stress protein [Natrarchaeobaculum sulfurireducens]AXR77429.1 Nucleotide-binding protein, UspA family [Natrarchaeobaculum sulfurireducens]AXR82600.1 Chloride channel protein [Natrarchaeobaculum sulfurireducens]
MADSITDTKTLLVPIASEETAERQLDMAIGLARERSYRIRLLYVLEVPPQLSLQDGRRYLLEEETETVLEAAANRVEAAGVPVDQRIRMARDVAAGIVGGATAYEAAELLLGWRGRPPREQVLLGSHLDTVLRSAPCDLLVERIKTPTPKIESVLVGVAGGPHDAYAAETAGAIARQHDASVTLLHVYDADDPDLSRAEANGLLARTAARVEPAPSVTRELVAAGDVAGTLTDWTADYDVTFLGTSRGGLLRRRVLGTVSEAVGRHAAGTVVLAKRHEPASSRLRRLF